MCDCALGVPFDGLDAVGDRPRDDTPGRASRVSASLGHLFVNTTWTQPATAVGSSAGSSSAGRLDVESLLSSAAITMEPDEFDVLQAVHVRVVGAMPLGVVGGGANDTDIRSSGGGGGSVVSNSSPRDDLAEKLREKTNRDDPVAVTSLPSRPVLCCDQGDGGVPERAQLGVAVSPIRFNITETHMLSLACFTLGASARLAAISDVLASRSSPDVQAQKNRSATDSTLRGSGIDLAPDEPERGEQPSRSGSSMVASSQATGVEGFDGVRAVGDTDGEVRGDAGQVTGLVVAVAKNQVAAPPPLPRGAQETPQETPQETLRTLDIFPPQHQHSNGLLSITEDRLGGAFGGSDQQQSSGQLAGEGEPTAAAAAATASETAVAKSPPVPPAFLGTFIIEAISVMLLEDAGDYAGVARATSDGPRGSMTADSMTAGMDTVLREQPASARGTNAVGLTPGRPRAALSPSREPSNRRRQNAGASAALLAPSRRSYSGTVFLEVEGIGVGVDLPRPWRTPSPPPSSPSPPPPGTTAAQSSPSSPVGSPVVVAAAVMEEGNSEGGHERGHQQEYRAECAIKRTSLTDVNAKRRPQSSLALLVSDGVSGAAADTAAANSAAASSASGAEERRRDVDEAGVRILPGGWWQHRNDGNSEDASSRYGEQVLLSARICPVSGVATVDALLGSARIMLLPAPILDALVMVAGVSQGVADFLRYTADAGAEVDDGGRISGVRATQLAAPENVARSADEDVRSSSAAAAATSSTPEHEGALPRNESAAGGGQQTGDGTAVSVPPVVSGRRRTTNEEEENAGDRSGALSPPRREDEGGDAPGDTQEQRHRNSWRWQLARALGDAGLADLLWLRRIDMTASARNLQLWLPGFKEGARAATVTTVDESGQGDVEAVVVACGHLFTDVSIAVGLLSEGAGMADSAEQLAGPGAPAGAAGEPGGSDAQQAAAVGDDEGNAGNAAAAAVAADFDAAETAFVDSCDELCVMILGLNGMEVFVARSSMADFGGTPAGESQQPVVASDDLGADNGEQPPAAPAAAPGVGREGLILPFNATIKHVLFARPSSSSCSASSAMPPSPSPSQLLSELDMSVTLIRVVLFLDFPLATRIMTNSLNPLLNFGTPASSAASGDRVATVTGAAGTPSVIHGLSSTLQGDGGGGLAGTSTGPVAVAAPPAAVPSEAAAISELARMWTCRGGVEAAGLRAEIVNNFYRQKRPCVIVNVRGHVFFLLLYCRRQAYPTQFNFEHPHIVRLAYCFGTAVEFFS